MYEYNNIYILYFILLASFVAISCTVVSTVSDFGWLCLGGHQKKRTFPIGPFTHAGLDFFLKRSHFLVALKGHQEDNSIFGDVPKKKEKKHTLALSGQRFVRRPPPQKKPNPRGQNRPSMPEPGARAGLSPKDPETKGAESTSGWLWSKPNGIPFRWVGAPLGSMTKNGPNQGKW